MAKIKKKRVGLLLYSMIYVVLFGILFLLLWLMFYFPFIDSGIPAGDSFIPQAIDEYWKEWNINIASCQESYFASSNHDAFGEGARYSVLSGSVSFPDSSVNQTGDKIFQISGDGVLREVGWFLDDIWRALEIPDDYRLALSQCEWILYSQEDGSKVLVAKSKEVNCSYIVELLL